MPTREQLTDERVRALIHELDENGVLPSSLCDALCNTTDLGEAEEVTK